MQVSTEERFALTVAIGSPHDPYICTTMYSSHVHLMMMVDYWLKHGERIVSVETLESAIRRDAMERGVW